MPTRSRMPSSRGLQNGFTQSIFNAWLRRNRFCSSRPPPEIAAGVTPVNYAYAPGHVHCRYGTNTTQGTTDMTTALNNSAFWLWAMGATVAMAGRHVPDVRPDPCRESHWPDHPGSFWHQCRRGHRASGHTYTGKAILSLVGSNAVTVGPVSLTGSATTKPQAGAIVGPVVRLYRWQSQLLRHLNLLRQLHCRGPLQYRD